ncbi:MAG TPA: hypothetical protein PK908_02315 [Bacteroidales bacterium]|nr:hypothetical protein [Bacteroidales bacterium]
MKRITKIILKIFLFSFSGLFFLSGCTVERKLAKQFVENRQNTSVLLIPANFVYKYNLKTYEVAGESWMDEATLDSVLYYRSLFVQYVSDSVFLETYMNELINGLRKRKLNVYLEPDTDVFFNATGDKYIVNVAQLMMEETVERVFDPEYDPEYDYIGDIYLNKIVLSSWLEISAVTESKPDKSLVYSDLYMNDYFEGRVRYFPFTGRMAYTYNIDSIDINDIYTMAAAAGNRYSGYIFDYFMNRYIERNIPNADDRILYFRYDLLNRSLKPSSDERFIILE